MSAPPTRSFSVRGHAFSMLYTCCMIGYYVILEEVFTYTRPLFGGAVTFSFAPPKRRVVVLWDYGKV